MKMIKRSLSFILILLFLLALLPGTMSAHADEGLKEERRILVALGDSYSSGEGIPPFFGSGTLAWEDKVHNEDWLAHRSEKAWSGMLKLVTDNGKGITMSDKHYDGTNASEANWFFAAASGAETWNIVAGSENKQGQKLDGKQEKEYIKEKSYHDRAGLLQGVAFLPPQIEIFDKTEKAQPDYVTLSIGGNDAGFVKILTEGAIGCDYVSGNLSKLIEDSENYLLAGTYKDPNPGWFTKSRETPGLLNKLESVYRAIWRKTEGKTAIIVVGYPQLVFSNIEDLESTESISNKFLYGENRIQIPQTKMALGVGFDLGERDTINKAVGDFNTLVENRIEALHQEGIPIYFVRVDGEDGFLHHEPGTKEPYINGIILPQEEDLKDASLSSLLSAYSFHPNEAGARAYAKCVQAKIDELEREAGRGFCGGEGDGTNCTWVLNKEDGTITIRSSSRMVDWPRQEGYEAPWYEAVEMTIRSRGRMADWAQQEGKEAPWYEHHRSSIRTAVIEDGVTNLGESAFYNCSLTSIQLPESVTEISSGALVKCDSLTDIYYAGSEEQWNRIAIHADNEETLRHVKIHFGKVQTKEPLVSDTRYERKSQGNLQPVEYHLPRINMESPDINRINGELRARLDPLIDRSVGAYGGKRHVECKNLSYQYAVKGDVLSLVVNIMRDPDFGGNQYLVYNISVSEKREIPKDEFFRLAGLSETETAELVRQGAEQYWWETWGNKRQYDLSEWDKDSLAKTLAEDNVSQARPFICEDGSLAVALDVYIPVESGKYESLVPLNNP